jgi:hypothetical protein
MKRMKQINHVSCRLWAFLLLLVFPISTAAQSTAFTYQGKLTDAGNPANGNYDMQFKLFDTPTVGTGTQQGPTIMNPTVSVSAGNFTATLDFGAAVFDGSTRYLEISVRPAGSPNPYTVLAPRVPITPSPYAIQTQQLGGLPASRYVKTETNGFVAIGTSSGGAPTEAPAHRLAVLGGPCWTGDCWGGALELDNASAIAWRANTSNVKFGIGRTENGLFFFRTMSPLGTTTNGPIYDFKMDNSGNVGIGQIGISTDLSGAKLTVQTSGYGMAQSDGTITVSSFINSSGGWFGTKSNHSLHFYTNNSTPRMSIDTAGNVSIGSAPNGNTKLGVESSLGSTISAINSAGGTAVYGSSPSGIGIFGSSDTNYAGFFQGTVRVTGGKLQLQALGSIGSQALCRNANDEISICSSSLRYKKDVQPFQEGLHFIERLLPLTYKWKADDLPDVGFGAEDVAIINPLFVTYNPKGEIEGVKYDRLSVVFVNAFKEQQTRLDAQTLKLNRQQAQLERQQREIDQLKQAVKALTAAAHSSHRRSSRARINNHY